MEEEKSALTLIKELVGVLGSRVWTLAKSLWASSYARHVITAIISGVAIYDRVKTWWSEERQVFVREAIQSSKLVLYVLSIIDWFKKKPEEDGRPIFRLPHDIGHQRLAESLVKGSEEVEMFHRNGEVVILNADKKAVGKGVRIWNALCVPEHVICTAEISVSGNGTVYMASPNKKLSPIKISTANPVELDTDLVAYAITEDDWSKVGVKQVNIAALVTPTVISITGVMGKGTTGLLKNCYEAGFGQLRYMGTTMAGYSGALYASGAQAMGMHCHGGSANLGFALDYVRCLVKAKAADFVSVSLTVPESRDQDDTWEFLQSHWFEGDELKNNIRVNHLDEERIIIQAYGKYHTFDRSFIGKYANDKQWNSLVYRDREYESVFAKSPVYGASKKSAKPVPLEEELSSAGTSESLQLSQISQALRSDPRGENRIYRWMAGLSEEKVLAVRRKVLEKQGKPLQ